MSGVPSKAETAASRLAGDAADISHVIAMTERVEAAIAAGDWQEAADLEAQRRSALVALLERGGAPASEDLRAALSGIVSRTHRMIGEAHHHRRSLLWEASSVQLGRKAADEYDRNSA